MSLGLPHNSENLNKDYTIFFGVGYEVVLSLKIQIPSLHIVLAKEMTNEEKYRLRLQELEVLDDKCLRAQ